MVQSFFVAASQKPALKIAAMSNALRTDVAASLMCVAYSATSYSHSPLIHGVFTLATASGSVTGMAW